MARSDRQSGMWGVRVRSPDQSGWTGYWDTSRAAVSKWIMGQPVGTQIAIRKGPRGLSFAWEWQEAPRNKKPSNGRKRKGKDIPEASILWRCGRCGVEHERGEARCVICDQPSSLVGEAKYKYPFRNHSIEIDPLLHALQLSVRFCRRLMIGHGGGRMAKVCMLLERALEAYLNLEVLRPPREDPGEKGCWWKG